MREMKVEVTFTEAILGTASGNPELHSEFIASKAPDAKTREEEVAALGAEEVEKKDMTVFPRTSDDKPFLYDYQIKGFFKHACGMLRNVEKTESGKIKAYKKFIDGLIFVEERQIPLQLPKGTEMGNCQRPLRASTAQGERIALANSEECPAGTKIVFTIQMLKDDLMAAVIEWLDYGKLNGIGQWHNSGKGRFTWRDITDAEAK